MTEKVFDGGLLPGKIAVGIDQSLTGFALAAVNVSKPEAYEIRVYKSGETGVRRLYDITQWLYSMFTFLQDEGCEIQDIAMEGTVLSSHSALVLGELSATVKLACWEYFEFNDQHLRTPLQVPPMTLKKYTTGKGTSKKQEMLLQIYKRWNVEILDDNAADAYALARLAAGIADTAIEKAVVEQLKDPKYRDK